MEKKKQNKNTYHKKKKHVEKHYSNPQCFVRKSTVVILNQLMIKIDKDNF
jgi:stalled ribosome alternative rescue factor ArfA